MSPAAAAVPRPQPSSYQKQQQHQSASKQQSQVAASVKSRAVPKELKKTQSLGLPVDGSRRNWAMTPDSPTAKRDSYILGVNPNNAKDIVHFHNADETMNKGKLLKMVKVPGAESYGERRATHRSPVRDAEERRPSPLKPDMEVLELNQVAGRASPTSYHDAHNKSNGVAAVFNHEDRPFVARGRSRADTNSTHDLLTPAPAVREQERGVKYPRWLQSAQMESRLGLKVMDTLQVDNKDLFGERGRRKEGPGGMGGGMGGAMGGAVAGLDRGDFNRRGGDGGEMAGGKRTEGALRGKESCKNVFDKNSYPKEAEDGVGKRNAFKPWKRVNNMRGVSQITF